MSLNILVVDPDAQIDGLDSEFQFTNCKTAEEAQGILHRERFNVAVLEPYRPIVQARDEDPMMDLMLMLMLESPSPKILITSALPEVRVYRRYSLLKGVDYQDFLEKPYTSNQLRAAILKTVKT